MQRPLQTSDLIALLARVAEGDRRAFSELYAATSAKLYGVVFRILPAKDRAEDVLQDAYVRIWNRAASYDARKASPIAWMATIARNRAIDEVRRRATLSIEDAPQALEVPAEGLDPLDATQQSEELQRLNDCLQALDADRRQMVLLAYHQGLSRDEIAQRFNHPVGTIKVWLHRSLAQLRKCLGS